MITQRDLSRLANRLYEEAKAAHGKNALRVAEDTVERDYCLAWLLCVLPSHTTLGRSLAFKGGTAQIENYSETTYARTGARVVNCLGIATENHCVTDHVLAVKQIGDLSDAFKWLVSERVPGGTCEEPLRAI